jgi:membrane protease YdiL (CAAX protease family)
MSERWKKTALPIALFLAAWGAATFYLGATGSDWVFPIIALLVFGGALPGLAWLLTRRSDPPTFPVPNPGRETLALCAYLLFYAAIFLGDLFTWLRSVIPEGREQDLAVLGYKLVIHVALPTLVLIAVGGRIAPMWTAGVGRRGFWPALVVLGIVLAGLVALVSPSLANIGRLGLSPAAAAAWAGASLVWVSIEAGLCEEYLFRAGLQSRLEAWLRSPGGAILLTSVVFALVHAPGLYLRGGAEIIGSSTDPVAVAAYTVATLAPVSILFGVIWARTRSLLLVVILHGSVDMLPNSAELVRHWG